MVYTANFDHCLTKTCFNFVATRSLEPVMTEVFKNAFNFAVSIFSSSNLSVMQETMASALGDTLDKRQSNLYVEERRILIALRLFLEFLNRNSSKVFFML